MAEIAIEIGLTIEAGGISVSVLPSGSSHKRHKSSAYDVYDYDQRIIYL